jgi:hypothetical protein
MNQTTPIDDQELNQLLPWYVNGTLNDDELRRVEDYLAVNASARTQVEFLQRLRDEVRGETVGSPGAFGHKRLQAAIASETQGSQPRKGLARWRAAAALGALAVLIQGAMLFDLHRQQDVYQPLGTDQGAGLQVIFHEQATERQIRTLLNEIGASIRSGPGALGIYRIELDTTIESDDPERVLESLRRASDVVSEAHLD